MSRSCLKYLKIIYFIYQFYYYTYLYMFIIYVWPSSDKRMLHFAQKGVRCSARKHIDPLRRKPCRAKFANERCKFDLQGGKATMAIEGYKALHCGNCIWKKKMKRPARVIQN